MRAAERLFAEHGIGPTSTRAILREAQQRNESALQYHFGGREGLIEALYAERGAQVGAERDLMLREVEEGVEVDVRRLCEVAVMPPVRIAQRQPEFILFLKVIGQLAFLPSQKLQEVVARYEGDSVAQVARRIRPQLRLPDALFARRMELTNRMAALSLAQRALADESFEGPAADLFFETLLDAMAEVLKGPPSRETKRCLAATSSSRERPRRTPGGKRKAPRSKKRKR